MSFSLRLCLCCVHPTSFGEVCSFPTMAAVWLFVGAAMLSCSTRPAFKQCLKHVSAGNARDWQCIRPWLSSLPVRPSFAVRPSVHLCVLLESVVHCSQCLRAPHSIAMTIALMPRRPELGQTFATVVSYKWWPKA